MDTEIKAKIIYTDEGASSTIEKVTKAVEGHAKASTDSAQATAKADTATKTATPNIGQFGSALGLAGQAVGKLNPALGGMVTMAGAATGAVQSLTTMGMGPLGIALGVLSVAISAGTALYAEYARAEEEATNKAKDEADAELKAAGALDKKTEAMRRNLTLIETQANTQRQAADVQERTLRLQSGLGPLDQTIIQQETAQRNRDRAVREREQFAAALREGAMAQQGANFVVTSTQLDEINKRTETVRQTEIALATAVRATATAREVAAAEAIPQGVEAPTDPDFMANNTTGGGRNRRAERAEQIMDEVQAEADAASALRQMNIDASDAEYTRRQDAYARMHDAEVARQEERLHEARLELGAH